MTQVIDATLDRVRLLLSGRAGKRIDHQGLRASAVLILLYPKDGSYCVLLNKRTDTVEFNKGEICFPGGAEDPEDADLRATALRETSEEMGVHPEDVTLFGELDETPVRSGFVIHPFVGTIPYPYQFNVSSQEVAAVLEVPFSVLYDEETLREEVRVYPEGHLTRTVAYAYDSNLVYGATARILTQLLDLIGESDGLKEALGA